MAKERCRLCGALKCECRLIDGVCASCRFKIEQAKIKQEQQNNVIPTNKTDG